MGFVNERTRKRYEPKSLPSDKRCEEIIQSAAFGDYKFSSAFIRQFVEDMSEKFDKYGGDTYISDKQRVIIAQILEEMENQ